MTDTSTVQPKSPSATGASIMSTAAGTTGAAALFPIVAWAIAGFPQPVPPDTAMAIAAYVAIGVHLIGVMVSRIITRFFPDLAAGAKPAVTTNAAPTV